MKRIIIVLLCLLICGCSAQKGKPKDLPQEVYDIAAGIVPAIEKVIDSGADPSTAAEKVNDAVTKISGIFDGLEKAAEMTKTSTVTNDLTKIGLSLTKLSTSWLTKSNDDASMKELKEGLKKLKKDIGM